MTRLARGHSLASTEQRESKISRLRSSSMATATAAMAAATATAAVPTAASAAMATTSTAMMSAATAGLRRSSATAAVMPAATAASTALMSTSAAVDSRAVAVPRTPSAVEERHRHGAVERSRHQALLRGAFPVFVILLILRKVLFLLKPHRVTIGGVLISLIEALAIGGIVIPELDSRDALVLIQLERRQVLEVLGGHVDRDF